MRRAAVTSLALIVTAGCVPSDKRRRASWEAALFGGGIAATGLAIASTARNDEERGAVFVIALPLIGAGLLAIVYGLDATGVIGRLEPDELPKRESIQDQALRAAAARKARRDHDRERAWQLTKASAAAARTGDCHVAIDFDDEIDALDPEFHDVVFLRDAAIARCLGAR
jgi:hypothetical protein